MNEECIYERIIIRERYYFVLFTFLSILIPSLTFIDYLRPANESLGIWFQRSGSTMVVFSLMAEMSAYKMAEVFKPTKFVGDTYVKTEKKYLLQTKVFNVIAFTLIVIGTVIWGYGDLLINLT